MFFLWQTWLYLSEQNTDLIGRAFARQFILYDRAARKALYDQDWGTYAAGLPQGLALAKAWAAHITNKSNQVAAAVQIQIGQDLLDKDRCGQLYVDDIENAIRKLLAMAKKFVEEFVASCAC